MCVQESVFIFWHGFTCMHIVSEGRKGKKKLDKVKDSIPPLLSRINGVMHVSFLKVYSYHYCVLHCTINDMYKHCDYKTTVLLGVWL